MFGKNDQRTIRRIAVECRVDYKVVNTTEFKHGIAKNISSKGILFEVDDQYEVGTMMEIKVAATQTIPAHGAIIEVVRVNPVEGDEKFEIAGLIKVIK